MLGDCGMPDPESGSKNRISEIIKRFLPVIENEASLNQFEGINLSGKR
jgi:hypothetical protein